MSACCLTISLKSMASVMEWGGLSTGILRHKALSPTIPERGFCGEPVEGAVIQLRTEENSNHRARTNFDAGVGILRHRMACKKAQGMLRSQCRGGGGHDLPEGTPES